MNRVAPKGAMKALNAIGDVATKTVSTATAAASATASVVDASAAAATKIGKGLAAGTAALAQGAVEGVQNSMLEVYDAVVERDNVPSELLEAPTPEDRWFDPVNGWPSAPAELPGPKSSTTTASKYKPHTWEPPPHRSSRAP